MNKISSDGYLVLDRKKTGSRAVMCPYHRSSQNDRGCGDWCSLFKEPILDYSDTEDSYINKFIVLELCNGSNWTFKEKEFIDERYSNGKE